MTMKRTGASVRGSGSCEKLATERNWHPEESECSKSPTNLTFPIRTVKESNREEAIAANSPNSSTACQCHTQNIKKPTVHACSPLRSQICGPHHTKASAALLLDSIQRVTSARRFSTQLGLRLTMSHQPRIAHGKAAAAPQHALSETLFNF